MLKQVLWAAGEVVQLDVIGVDSEVAVQSGEDFAKVNGAFNGFSTESISRSDDLSRFHTATGE